MTYEQVIDSVRTVPQERLEELNTYIVHFVQDTDDYSKALSISNRLIKQNADAYKVLAE